MSAAALIEAADCASAEIRIDERVTAEVADARGYLRGGALVRWMDAAGMLAATRHCRKPAVATAIDDLELPQPILIGERVSLAATVTHAAPRSVGVTIAVHHGGLTTRAQMTFVAPNADGHPGAVPQLPTQSGPRPRLASLAESSAWSANWRQRPSYVHAIEPVRVGDLVFRRPLHGCGLFRFAIEVATRSASAHLDGAPVRLSGVHGATLVGSPPRDLFLHIRSVIAHAGERSVTALVDVQAEDPIRANREPVLRALLTHAPVDAVPIPALVCGGDLEQALFREVDERLRRAGNALGLDA